MPTLKEIEEYKKEIDRYLKSIGLKTDKIRSFSYFYLRNLMRKEGFEESVIAECLS